MIIIILINMTREIFGSLLGSGMVRKGVFNYLIL